MNSKQRVVRNFWIELRVDGKKERIATGPRYSHGGFTMEIKMRGHGEVTHGLELRGFVAANGKLCLVVEDPDVRGKQGYYIKSKER